MKARRRTEFRSVMEIGGCSLMITLPRKWCYRNDIIKGDSLNLVVDKKEIIIKIPRRSK